MKKTILWSVVACAGLALGACTPKDDTMATGSGTPNTTNETNADTEDQNETENDEDQGTDGPVATSGQTDGPDTMDPDDGSDGGFIAEPDGGGVSFECDVFAQDCPEGEKCMAWANDGGSSWNATRCSPISPNPGQPGDPCTVEGSGVSGVDDCDIGAMCWDVDPETNMGVCVALCTGDATNPICEDPDTECAIVNEGALNLCLPSCDPLLQDCPDGQACYPVIEAWQCVPDASGEMGAYGDPCEFINVCDPGLMCLGADATPGCAGAVGCCTEVCDISDPAGNAQCSGEAGGQECQAWYEEGSAPPGYEDVGACAIPA